MHRHTAPLADCLDQNRQFSGAGGWIRRPFPASGADVHGVEFAALDTLHQGLPGDAVGEGCLEHGQPAVGGVLDEQGADLVGEPDAPGRARGELLAGDEPVAEPTVQGGGRQAQLFGGVGHGEQLCVLRVVAGLVAGDFIFSQGQGTHALLLELKHLAHRRIVE